MNRRTLGLGLVLMVLIVGNSGNIAPGQAQAGPETIHWAGDAGTLPDVQVQLTSEPIDHPGSDLQTWAESNHPFVVTSPCKILTVQAGRRRIGAYPKVLISNSLTVRVWTNWLLRT